MQANVAKLKRELKATWETLPDVFETSAEKSKGRDELLDFIEKVNKAWTFYS